MPHMSGTSLSVVFAMRRMPPNRITPTHAAIARPNRKPWSNPVTARNWAKDWLTWKSVSEPPTAATQKNPARKVPSRGMPMRPSAIGM